ncbi:hypothetical protein AKJ61_01125 [candidate division MSBL1 archaeon SCGC-AAA259B11]|uniref:Threonine synthase n=1 Tax=candidate division MSBL1 archaeon SCGC-AAA259B11 TaxID=1698260 RepID=A0A133U7R7_9EURY|nr:hypothetical protein AKJ61_01125 [candidate division MSBL1 archaeon SCGC-AAA259B11]
MFVESLNCQKCGKKFPPKEKLYVCKNCGGKLTVVIDYEKVKKIISRQVLEDREGGVWKYKELLPVDEEKNMISIGEGNTPLIKVDRLGDVLGINDLWLKEETQNPTSSFKDRPMSVGVSKALEFDAETVVTASSGNAATALAAYSAKGDIECYAFVPEDAPEAKIAQIALHGANVVRAASQKVGDPCYELMKLGFENFGWHPIPSGGAFNPYQPEGNKTMSFEICEQFDWQPPDWHIVPVGAGTLLSGNAKGYFEFEELGIVEEVPKIGGIQAEGCAPLVKGFKEDLDPYEIPTWENPETVAGGLMDPYPWDADTAIPAIKKSEGTAEMVSDEEILSAVKLLAESEGIFAEPSGAAGIAGLIELLKNDIVDRSEKVVVNVTGGGLKDQETAVRLAGETPKIEAKLDQLKKLVQN